MHIQATQNPDFKFYPPNSLPDHQATWKRAAIGTNQADPFCCTPTWQMAFHDAFGPKRRLLIAAHSDSLVAFAEYASPQGAVVLTPIEPHWFFGCPLLGKDAVELLNTMIDDVGRLYAPTFPRIIISGIRPGGILSERLIRTFADRFNLYLNSSGEQCAASLAGGVDGYLSRRSGNHRKKLRKQSRRATSPGSHAGFQSTPPFRGRPKRQPISIISTKFQSTPPCGPGK